MKPTILVNIDVDDLERAEAFYCAAFGLTVGRRFDASAVEIVGASCPIYLLAKPANTPASEFTSQRRSYERHWTPVHIDVVVDSIGEALRRATAAGAIAESDIRTHSWGHIALLSDPFGHGFCLIQFIGKGYDEIASSR